VLDQPPGHPWHVRWLPSEDVSVSPEEADERVFLFRVKARPDRGSLAAVACPKVDRLDLVFLRWLRLVGCVRFLSDVELAWSKLLGCSIDLSIMALGT
jgi:hypothetical protein